MARDRVPAQETRTTGREARPMEREVGAASVLFFSTGPMEREVGQRANLERCHWRGCAE